MYENKTLIKKEAGVELYKCSVSGSSYYLITYDNKKYIHNCLTTAQAVFNSLLNNKS